MDKHEAKVTQGEEAERLLASPMFNQAFTDTRMALMNAWAQLDTTEGRYSEYAQDLHRKIKCLDAVRKAIEYHVATGKLAIKEIEGKKRAMSWVK